MDELIQKVIDKTGLPADKAKETVDTVLEFIKDKLPAGVGAQVTASLENVDADQVSGMLGQAKGALGGMFGKKD